MSEWNKLSGCWSWEERDHSKWADQRLPELLRAQTAFEGSVSVDKCEGEATNLFLRGKKRARAEYEDLKIEFSCKVPSGATVRGRATIPEISSEDIDDFTIELKVTEGGSSEASEANKLLRGMIKTAFQKLTEELLERNQ
eukprot:m51a1_g3420 hypothetical protein (140) ;mRNA; r:588196-588820